ncbi:PLxRFG domain-containing protein [Solidesulfovibrio sp.]
MAPDQQNALGKVLGIKPGRKSRLGFLEAIFDTPELKLRAAYDTVVGEAKKPLEAVKPLGLESESRRNVHEQTSAAEALGGDRPQALDAADAGATGRVAQTPELESAAGRLGHDQLERPDAGGQGLRGDRQEPGRPDQQRVVGNAVAVKHAEGEDAARYEIREASDVIPSHDVAKNFTKHPDYPASVQERPYHSDQGEQQKVKRNAANLDPRYLVTDNPDAINGPPVITETGRVMGGNSRAMSLALAYAEHPERAAAYRADLRAKAAGFGFTPEAVDGFDAPVLVRVLAGDHDEKGQARLSRVYNQTSMQGLSVKAEGVSRGRLVSPSTLSGLSAGLERFATLREYLADASSRALVDHLVTDGVLEQTQLARLTDRRTGLLNEDGKRLVENTLRGRAVADADVLASAAPAVLQKIDRALPHVAVAQARGGSWDLSGQLRDAVDQLNRFRASGQDRLETYLGQGALVADAAKDNPAVQAMALALHSMTPRQFQAAWEQYASHARASKAGQGVLAGVSMKSPGQAFQESFQLQKREGKQLSRSGTPASSQQNAEEQNQTLGLALGEKIGGSRKDTAAPTGPRVRLPGKDDSVPAWKKRFMAVQVSETGFRSGEDKTYWSIADQKGTLRTGRFRFDSKDEAEAAIPLAAVSLKHRVTKRGEAWEIYRKVTDRKTVVIKDGFATEEDAKRYMAEHAEDILNTKTGFGEEILARPEKVFRKGAPRREGPAKGQDFLDAFGFRGVEFGEWNDQAERQEVLNHAYDGLLDLAEILNVPPKALSLNGDLALAFGSRGRGLSSAKAHYERDYGVINLTKLTGAGSLAHEWYHALDHYLGRQDTKASSEKVENKRGDQVFAASDAPSRDYLSHGASRKSQVREALRAAYEKLLGDIAYKAEQYKEDTEKAEQFVSRARGYLERNLKDIRTGLAQETQWGRKRAPATAGQLERFDALAEQLLSGDNLALEMRSNEAGRRQRSRFGSYRSSNDILDGLAAIYKEVRGRSGFNAERTGPFNSLAANVQDFARRAKMLEDARSKTEKTKQIPTEYRRAAYLMDQGRTSDYWSEPHELAARAFSAYVEDRVAQDNGRSDFLVYGANNAMLEYRLFNVRPFPEGAEREAINAAFDRFFQTVKTRETDRGVAMFRRGEESGSASSPLTRAVAAELRQGVAQFPALRGIVDVYQSESDMPADLREAVEDAGVSGRFHGAYDAETKRIALVAGNIPTVKAAQTAFVSTLFRHEGRHAGLDRVLGGVQEREDYMARAAQAIPREVTRWLTRQGMESNRRNRAEAAEEILVSWGKDGTVHRALDRLLSKIAAWVRSIFPTLELTRAELRQLLAQADDFVDGKGLDFIPPLGQPFSAVPAFSRTDEAGGYSVEDATMLREAATFREAREAVRGLIDKEMTNDATGMVATVSRTNIGKMLSWKAVGKSVSPKAQSFAVANLDRLFKIADAPDTHPDRDSAAHLNAVHRFYAPMIYDGEVLVAKMTVKDYVDKVEGIKIYSIEAMEIEKAAKSRETSLPEKQERETSHQAAFMEKIRALEAKVKGEDKAAGPRFARTGDLTGVPDEKRDVAAWLKDEASANVRSILAGVHGLSETGVLGRMVRSPEYWKQPVLKRLYETFRDRTDRAHELLHQAFDVGDGRTIIQEAKIVLKDQKQRDILNEGVDHADVNEIGPEAMEAWFAEHGADEATIGLWRIMRERYDMLLDERLAAYRKLIDKARAGYERKIVRRLIDAGIPADAARAFDAAGYNTDKTLADELAPYADEVKTVVATARKAGVSIKGQLSDVKLHDENGTSFSFAEMVEKMGQLRGFYAPRLREQGDYVVRGQRTGADGTVERFRAHKEWRKAAEKLRLEMQRGGWDMEPVDKLDKLPEATQGLLKTLELAKTVESAVNQVGEDVDAGLVQELLETLADEVKARGFRSQSIRRSGRHGDVVQGYFKDAVERFARYAGSTAYGLAKMEAAEKAAKVLFGTAGTPGLDIKKERDTYRLAVDYLAENLRNAEAGDRVFALAKSVASLKYLGLNPKSALINLSSMATSVPAALHAYAMQGKGGWARVGREIARSMWDYLGRMTGKWGRFNQDEQRFLDEIRRESLDDPQFAREALSVYRDTAGQGWSWLMGKSMALFGATEQLNRGATMLAGYRLARAGGADHATAVARARETSDRAHGVYDRATQPAWTWGTSTGARVGQAWYVYKKYGHNYLQLVHELWTDKRDRQAALFALAAPAVLGGLGGHVLTSLAKALVAAGGGDDDPEKWVYDFLGRNVSGEAEDLARFGLLGLATGADLSGSLGTMIDMPDTWSDVLGPMGGMAKDVLAAVGYLAGGQPGRAAEKALPSGVAKILQAVRESDQGVTTGKNYPVIGEDGKPLKPTRGESVAKGLGFRPLREARARDRTSEAITEERRFGDRRDTIYARFRAFALDGGQDADVRQSIVSAVADFNQDVAEAGLIGRVSPITRESLLRQTERLARPTKRERARLSGPAGRAEAAPAVAVVDAGDIEDLSHPYYELRRTYLDAKGRYDALRDAGDLEGAMTVRSETRLPRLRALVGRVQSIHADMAELRKLRLDEAVKARRMDVLRERERREMDRAVRAWGARAANGE